jgi:hypothetical protein
MLQPGRQMRLFSSSNDSPYFPGPMVIDDALTEALSCGVGGEKYQVALIDAHA